MKMALSATLCPFRRLSRLHLLPAIQSRVDVKECLANRRAVPEALKRYNMRLVRHLAKDPGVPMTDCLPVSKTVAIANLAKKVC